MITSARISCDIPTSKAQVEANQGQLLEPHRNTSIPVHVLSFKESIGVAAFATSLVILRLCLRLIDSEQRALERPAPRPDCRFNHDSVKPSRQLYRRFARNLARYRSEIRL